MSLLFAVLGAFYITLVGLTSRIRVHRSPAAQELMSGPSPLIFAFWHRYQLLMAWEHRRRGVHVLVSRSKDGDLIANAIHLLGYRTVRGSSSRGGAVALRELLNSLAQGARTAVTPDGPKGPFRSIQPGMEALALKSGAPVVPCGWAGTRTKELNTWDRFLIPLPFGRYEIVFGDPVHLSPDEKNEDRLRTALDSAVSRAQTLLASGLR